MNLPVTLGFQNIKRSQDFKTFGEIRVTADPKGFFYDIAVMQLECGGNRMGERVNGSASQAKSNKRSMGNPFLFYNIEELYCGGSLAISLIDSGTTYRALAEIQGEQTKTSTDKKVGATSKLTTPDLQDPYADFLCVLIVLRVYSYEVI